MPSNNDVDDQSTTSVAGVNGAEDVDGVEDDEDVNDVGANCVCSRCHNVGRHRYR